MFQMVGKESGVSLKGVKVKVENQVFTVIFRLCCAIESSKSSQGPSLQPDSVGLGEWGEFRNLHV